LIKSRYCALQYRTAASRFCIAARPFPNKEVKRASALPQSEPTAAYAVLPPMQVDQPVDSAWAAAMRRGDLQRAWQICDAHLRRRLMQQEPWWDRPRHLQPVWNGEPLGGKRVLVRCYHGLGDTIQFIRFVRPLRRIARSVVLWAQPALIPIARSVAGVDETIPLHDGSPQTGYNADVEIMELPHALRIASIPRDVPYLFVPHQSAAPARDRSFSVGLVWAAGDWDEGRSLRLKDVKALARIPGIRFFSLQRGPWASEAPSIPAIQWGADDVIETAARMLALDLIISVDTMAAHLAGALARPVWLLLQRDCDWRWPREGANTVWYPTMRLFHQSKPGDWTSAIEHLHTALKHCRPPTLHQTVRAET
jgi:hypothetical protein